MSYEIKLPLFEGPFDLLLFFIERDELDIMDIPISQITNDFLEYVSDLVLLHEFTFVYEFNNDLMSIFYKFEDINDKLTLESLV